MPFSSWIFFSNSPTTQTWVYPVVRRMMYKENKLFYQCQCQDVFTGMGWRDWEVIPWPHELQEEEGWLLCEDKQGEAMAVVLPSRKHQLTTKSNTYQWIPYLPFWKHWISEALAHQGLLGSLNVGESLTFDLACSLSGVSPKRKTSCSYSPSGYNDMGTGKTDISST